MEIDREVVYVRPKAADIQYHVSVISTDHGKFLDFREYVKSLDEYGRGMTFPAEDWDKVARALAGALEEDDDAGADASDPMPVV